VEEFVRPVIAALPSAAGREVVCGESKRVGLSSCCFDGSGTPPRLTSLGSSLDSAFREEEEEEGGYEGLVTTNATRLKNEDGTNIPAARIEVSANNTKACFLEFETPVSALRVQGSSGWDERFGQYPEAGVKNLRLWHRKWDEAWVVEVEWKEDGAAEAGGSESGLPSLTSSTAEGGRGDGELKMRRRREGGLKGAVVCMWSDANVPGTIPALDEALQFAPAWAAITKLSEGLVEGRKAFEV
jgi:hypothetical protein